MKSKDAGQDKEAESAAKKGVPSKPFEGSLSAGYELFKKRNFKACREWISANWQSREASRRRDEIFLLKGLCLQGEGNHREALEAFDTSLRARASNSDTLYYRALSLQQTGAERSALSSLEEAVWFKRNVLAPSEELYLALGKAYRAEALRLQQEGDPKTEKRRANLNTDAERMLAKSIEANRAFVPARAELASLKIERGQAATAIDMLEEAVAADPRDPALKLSLAKALLGKNEPLTAPERAARARDLSSATLSKLPAKERYGKEAYVVYLRSLIMLGQSETAERELRAALQVMPDNPQFKRLLNQVAPEPAPDEGPGSGDDSSAAVDEEGI